MLRKGKLDINEAAVAKALKSRGMQAEVKARVDRIAAAAGPGFEASVVVGRNRVHGSVITKTKKAARQEAKHRALSRAVDAGRG